MYLYLQHTDIKKKRVNDVRVRTNVTNASLSLKHNLDLRHIEFIALPIMKIASV